MTADGVRLSRLYLVAAWERPGETGPAEPEDVSAAPGPALSKTPSRRDLPPTSESQVVPGDTPGGSARPVGAITETSDAPPRPPPELSELLEAIRRFGSIAEVHPVIPAGGGPGSMDLPEPPGNRDRPAAARSDAASGDRSATPGPVSGGPPDSPGTRPAPPAFLFDLTGLLSRLWLNYETHPSPSGTPAPTVVPRVEPPPSVAPSAPAPPTVPQPSRTQSIAGPPVPEAQGLFDLPNLLERVLSMPATGSPSVHYAFARAMTHPTDAGAPTAEAMVGRNPTPPPMNVYPANPDSHRNPGSSTPSPAEPAPAPDRWEGRRPDRGWSARRRPYTWVCPSCRQVNPPWSDSCARCHITAPSN